MSSIFSEIESYVVGAGEPPTTEEKQEYINALEQLNEQKIEEHEREMDKINKHLKLLQEKRTAVNNVFRRIGRMELYGHVKFSVDCDKIRCRMLTKRMKDCKAQMNRNIDKHTKIVLKKRYDECNKNHDNISDRCRIRINWRNQLKKYTVPFDFVMEDEMDEFLAYIANNKASYLI